MYWLLFWIYFASFVLPNFSPPLQIFVFSGQTGYTSWGGRKSVWYFTQDCFPFLDLKLVCASFVSKWSGLRLAFFLLVCVCLCVNVLCSSKFGHFISILSYHSLGSREKGGKKSIHGRRRTFSQWGHGFLFGAFWIRLAKNVDTSLRFMYAFSCPDVTRLKWPFVQ